jgi:hypothetical protein
MRTDYQDLFTQLKDCMIDQKLEFVVIKESQLTSELLMPNKWIIEFDCEKYDEPSFTISIYPPKNIQSKSKSYAVWILMKILEKSSEKRYGAPTIENQIKFLNAEREIIFSNSLSYENQYEKFN